MKLQSYTGGRYALSGTKEELRKISDRLLMLLADMDRIDAEAAKTAGPRGIGPVHSVTLGLPELEPGIEAIQ